MMNEFDMLYTEMILESGGFKSKEDAELFLSQMKRFGNGGRVEKVGIYWKIVPANQQQSSDK